MNRNYVKDVLKGKKLIKFPMVGDLIIFLSLAGKTHGGHSARGPVSIGTAPRRETWIIRRDNSVCERSAK